MKSFFFCFLFSLFTCVFGENLPSNGVTYTFSRGRFGDNLISYLHAKWVSYKYDVPLLYRPFPYSSDLRLDDQEIHFSISSKYLFNNIVTLKNDTQISLDHPESTLFILPYYSEAKYEIDHSKRKRSSFCIDWKDKEFRSVVRSLIAPKNNLTLISTPSDSITVALHFRTGGGFDSPAMVQRYFWKMPPLQFYCDSLLKIMELLPKKRIFCYLFTDAVNPQALIDKIKVKLPKNAVITFDFRKSTNRHDANVLEDFFSFFLFDCLIRPDSNFSIVPSLIHDFALVISPGHFSRSPSGVWNVDELSVSIDQGLHEELLKNSSYDL